jgi:hypothetical protein
MTAFIFRSLKNSRIFIQSLLVLFFFACEEVPEQIPEYGWFDFAVSDLDTTGNVIDLSFLNEKSAGAAGFVTVQEGHFADGNGQRIKFFGDNLTFSACFPEKETATRIAASLAKKGMNVIRFHHMDNRSTPDGIWDESREHFDPDQLDKMDWLIYQLKSNGIYSNLNLHVSFTYPGVDYDMTQFNYGKTIDNFYRPYIEMQKDYARNLLTHRNPYTGTTYLEEPAVAFIELNNENSLLTNVRLLPQLNKAHRKALLEQWKAWLGTRGKGVGNLDLFKIIEGYNDQSTLEQKDLMWSFLVDTEMAYANEMISYVRDELGAQSLIADTQASYSGVAGVYREASYSDYIDMHAYWEHPRFPGIPWSRTDWLIRNSSMVTDKNAGTLKRFAQYRVTGMPLTISEYDHPAPNFFCAEMYPMLNAVAAFQDWDGIYHFDYNGPYDAGRINGFFTSAGHPLKQIFIPVGAVMFRMETINAGENKVQLYLPKNTVIQQLVESEQEMRLRATSMDQIWTHAGAPEALTLMRPTEVNLTGEELKLSEPVNEPEGPWTSETGELTWDNLDSLTSVFTVNATAVKAAVGYIGGRDIELGNVAISMDSTEYNWATITLTSLDGEPLETAGKILLVAAGRVENTGMGWNEDKTSVGADWGIKPSRAEGIPAYITLSEVERFKVFALDTLGNKGQEIRVKRTKQQNTFVIGAQYKTLWYLLERE